LFEKVLESTTMKFINKNDILSAL